MYDSKRLLEIDVKVSVGSYQSYLKRKQHKTGKTIKSKDQK